MRKSARKVQSTFEKVVRQLELAEARLDAFHSGPFAAFSELQKGSLRPGESIAEALEEIAAKSIDALAGAMEEPAAMSTQTKAVAWTPSSPVLRDATYGWALAADARAHADAVVTQVPTANASAPAAADATFAQEEASSTRASGPAAVAFTRMPTAHASAYADTTLAWAATVKTADPADNVSLWEPPHNPAEATLGCAPTINMSASADAVLAWAPTEILTDES